MRIPARAYSELGNFSFVALAHAVYSQVRNHNHCRGGAYVQADVMAINYNATMGVAVEFHATAADSTWASTGGCPNYAYNPAPVWALSGPPSHFLS
jgi:hypothetical protein